MTLVEDRPLERLAVSLLAMLPTTGLILAVRHEASPPGVTPTEVAISLAALVALPTLSRLRRRPLHPAVAVPTFLGAALSAIITMAFGVIASAEHPLLGFWMSLTGWVGLTHASDAQDVRTSSGHERTAAATAAVSSRESARPVVQAHVGSSG